MKSIDRMTARDGIYGLGPVLGEPWQLVIAQGADEIKRLSDNARELIAAEVTRLHLYREIRERSSCPDNKLFCAAETLPRACNQPQFAACQMSPSVQP